MADRKHAATPPTDTPARAPRDRRDEADENEPSRQGDVLGLSNARARIPQATKRKGGNPRGIEVGDSDEPGSLEQGPGATSIDMCAGGEGHKVKR